MVTTSGNSAARRSGDQPCRTECDRVKQSTDFSTVTLSQEIHRRTPRFECISDHNGCSEICHTSQTLLTNLCTARSEENTMSHHTIPATPLKSHLRRQPCLEYPEQQAPSIRHLMEAETERMEPWHGVIHDVDRCRRLLVNHIANVCFVDEDTPARVTV